ncbi:LysR family transcriptional regulator [Agrobacterium tumefaciens]|uniref:LysR family transcriptional regulator n=1 Tax=Agrobacterium tumefaciens TaxID=358 RepID=UPI00287D59B9|nr:LysR family transcriptional regulator [Agrobacterium tumefaciens]MDS7597618.1 LysR family transcriptional regulator [Agrobacterium tumefaciens]
MIKSRDVSWDFYRTFLGVLRDGSLSAAARELGITQPTAGRHIGALEEAIGFPLFIRSPHGLMPTEAALALRPYAENLAATASALMRAASGEVGKIEGTVRISASDIIGVEILPSIITALQETHPKLEIELSLSDTLEDLLRREADIAIRMTEPQQDAIVMRYIGNFRLGFHATRKYLEKAGIPAEMNDLDEHRLIGFDRKTPFIRAAIQNMRSLKPEIPDAEEISFSVRADSNLAQLAMIRAGAGIGVCQIGMGQKDPELVRVINHIDIPLHTWVAMHENLKTSPRCRAVFSALVDGLKAHLKETDPDAPPQRR